jgi:lambda family phage portal protein
MNFYDIQRAAIRSIVVNGEAVILPVRVERPGSPYALAMEVIEPDRLEAPGQMDQPNGRFNRRSGVELGKYGQPVAYWIRVSHPGDGIFERHNDSRHRRITAFDQDGHKSILHLMNNTRPGQTRGEPMLAPALSTFRDLGSWNEAVLVRERIAACHSMFISKDDPYTSAVNRADDTVSAQRLQEIEPGMISYLAPGESVTFGNPGSGNSNNYDQFVMRHLRSIGAALGLPYELVSKDFSQTNYSSARAALLEARRVFNRWQRYLIEHLCTHAYSMVIEEAWLRGEIPFREFDEHREALTASRWVPPTFGWVDPRKEVEAATLSIQTGLSSLAIEAAAQGRDWEQVLEQQAREKQLRQELGLQTEPPDKIEESDEPGA